MMKKGDEYGKEQPYFRWDAFYDHIIVELSDSDVVMGQYNCIADANELYLSH